MNRITRSALALVVTAALTFASAGSASAVGFQLSSGKATTSKGGGVGCCPGAV